jgi:plastocyanin
MGRLLTITVQELRFARFLGAKTASFGAHRALATLAHVVARILVASKVSPSAVTKEDRMSIRLAAILTLAASALAGTPAALAAGGSITGTVKIKGAAQPAVVYVEAAPGTFPAPAAHVKMDQQGMKFIPYLLPVLVGTTVDFINSDPVSHNVFSPDGEGYNLGSWPKGESKPYTFKKTGVYTQLCSIHPEMEAFVVVLQNPYFAVADKDGNFKIGDVPDGHYVLKVFAKKLKKAEKEKGFPVDVTKGTASTAIAF